jgi:hypothetical protein
MVISVDHHIIEENERMWFRQKLVYIVLGGLLAVLWQVSPDFLHKAIAAEPEGKTQYLVMGTGGPGWTSPEEAVRVLEGVILPGFDYLAKLKAEKKLLAGGLPVGDRSFVFIVEASSNAEVDQLVRNVPFWAGLDWKVTPLQSFEGRAALERASVLKLKENKQ